MSTLTENKDDLLFIFVGNRGLQIGQIFFSLIKKDYKGKRYDILDFFSNVFFICETEDELRRIGALIEGYVPEENILFMGNLNTSGDLWSNIEENDDIFAKKVFSPLMFASDQLSNPKLLIFYDLSNGKQAGICDYILENFPLVKRSIDIYIVATTSIDEGAGALSIYWSILGLNSIIRRKNVRACLLLDYTAIGNSIYLHRIKSEDEFDFESYNYVVAFLIYSLTHYDREPYANSVPFCQMIDKLVLFDEMKFIIPFITKPKRELIEDETFSGYLNELVNDCNLFSMYYKIPDKNGDKNDLVDAPKMSISNAFIAFGERQDTDYLNLVRNNLPPIMNYLPGNNTFYTYPRGDPFSIFLENNTVIRQYFQDLLEKFDILMSHHSYLHVLEELHITKDSFTDALDKLISLIDGYQECEDLLYDFEDFDYDKEIEKYKEKNEMDYYDEEPPGSITQETQNIDDEKLENNEKEKVIENEKEKVIGNEKETGSIEEKFDANSISKSNERTIKQSRTKKKRRKKRKTQSITTRPGSQKNKEKNEKNEEGALKWLEMRADKEKEKIQKEKDEILKERENFIKQKEEFEENQNLIRFEKKRKQKIDEEEMKKKKDNLKDLAKIFDNL